MLANLDSKKVKCSPIPLREIPIMPNPRSRSTRPHPSTPLSTALQVAQAITEKNASRPMNRLLLAEAMGYSPSSSGFRDRVSASAKYGLTEGNYSSETVSLSSLGLAASKPRNEAERIEAKRNALRTIPLFNDLIGHFANAKLPDPEFLKNILERAPFNIDAAWSESAAAAFTDDAREVGYLRNIGGSPHIVLDASGATPAIAHPFDEHVGDPDSARSERAATTPIGDPIPMNQEPDVAQPVREPAGRPIPMQLFIAHGSNRNR